MEVDKKTFDLYTRGLQVMGTETYGNGDRKDFYSYGPGFLVGCAYHTGVQSGNKKTRYTLVEERIKR